MFLCCDREGLMSVGEIYSRKSDWSMRESPNTNEMQKESVQKLEVFGKGDKRLRWRRIRREIGGSGLDSR